MLLDLTNLALTMRLDLLVMRLIRGKDNHVINSIRKLGFSQEATLANYVKDQEGRYYDLAILIKRLNKSWED